MKKIFDKKWKRSTQPRKQRKYVYNAPLHILRRMMSVCLSKDLRKRHKMRNINIRKGDKVRVLRGQYKGKTGRVDRVSIKNRRVYITGIELIRKEGTKSLIPLVPSNLQITELDRSDKRRFREEKNGKETS